MNFSFIWQRKGCRELTSGGSVAMKSTIGRWNCTARPLLTGRSVLGPAGMLARIELHTTVPENHTSITFLMHYQVKKPISFIRNLVVCYMYVARASLTKRLHFVKKKSGGQAAYGWLTSTTETGRFCITHGVQLRSSVILVLVYNIRTAE